MALERFISVQFCDDIRQEIGNKFSLIGCYGSELHVTPLPSVLPKLCAAIKVYTPIGKPFAKLIVRILHEGKPIGEVSFPSEGLVPAPVAPDGAQLHLVMAMIAMSPFAVAGPCVLKVEAETEDEVLEGGRLWIRGPLPAR